MPHPITATGTFIEIKVGGYAVTRINYSKLDPVNDTKRVDEVRDRLQTAIDTRISIADLPDDEPTKTVDPAIEFSNGGKSPPSFFWGDSQGKVQANPAKNDHLIARDTLITDVIWDGTRYSVTQVGLPGKARRP